jgi:hypothetical protein
MKEILNKLVGKLISRTQALKIAGQILKTAEMQRKEFAKKESKQGIHYEEFNCTD